MSTALSNDEFLNRLKEKRPEIEALEEYKGTNVKIKCLCKKHNVEFDIRPRHLWIGVGCKECEKEKRHAPRKIKVRNALKPQSHFERLLYEHNPYIILEDKYEGRKKKNLFYCVIHDCMFEDSAQNVLNSSGCPYCTHEAITNFRTEVQRKSREKFEKEMEKYPDMIALDDYKGLWIPITFKNLKTGETWVQTPKSFLQKREYEKVKEKNKENKKEDIKEITIKSKVGKKNKRLPLVIEYRPDILDYIVDKREIEGLTSGSMKKVKMKCPNCGYEKEMKVGRFTQIGFRCPLCSDGVSFPNKVLRNLFVMLKNENNNLEYKWEYRMYSENDKLYIYDMEFILNGIKYLVEVDGGFHFSHNSISGESYESIQKKDKKKQILAEEKGFKFIRINCSQKNQIKVLDNILNSELKEILPLEKIDKIELLKKSQVSIMKKVCEFYEENKNNRYVCKLTCEYFHISHRTFYKYVKYGTELGFCSFECKNKSISKNNKLR